MAPDMKKVHLTGYGMAPGCLTNDHEVLFQPTIVNQLRLTSDQHKKSSLPWPPFVQSITMKCKI